MSYTHEYSTDEPSRDVIDGLSGAAVLEFGNGWCGHCQRSDPLVRYAFAQRTSVRHIRVADGRGRRLGRSFGVKLWPTLVFLKDGQEVSRLVRPLDQSAIDQSFDALTT